MKKRTKKIQTRRKRGANISAPVSGMRSIAVRFLVLMLVIGLNWNGFFAIGETVAYFNDTETSSENSFGAGSLDAVLTETEAGGLIGLGEDMEFRSILLNSGTLDWKYTVRTEKISGSDTFCSALTLEAELNSSEKYDGVITGMDLPVSSTLGTWDFEVGFNGDGSGISHGDTCVVDVVLSAWQAEVGDFEESGFWDEERITLSFTARMVVLNEFLPNPEGFEYGFDFGTDSDDMPKGEWVELYNNSDTSYDLTGWYVWDASGSEANKIAITAANTAPSSTTIGGKDWLVVYMNKAVLNNTGDTVKLYDAGDTLIDSHEYTDNDWCDLEPTAGDENDTTVSGACGGVPPNKSYARIPDGIGGWVDPIPTPGGVNILEDDFVAASAAAPVAVQTNTDSRQEEVVEDTPIVIFETADDTASSASSTDTATTTPESIDDADETATTTPDVAQDTGAATTTPETIELQPETAISGAGLPAATTTPDVAQDTGSAESEATATTTPEVIEDATMPDEETTEKTSPDVPTEEMMNAPADDTAQPAGEPPSEEETITEEPAIVEEDEDSVTVEESAGSVGSPHEDPEPTEPQADQPAGEPPSEEKTIMD